MVTSDFVRISPLEFADYRSVIAPVSEAVWPEFMHHDPVALEHWDGLYDRFPAYQFALLDRAGSPAAIANSVPLAWDRRAEELPAEGWDWALIQSAADYTERLPLRTLCGIQIAIHPQYQGRRLSNIMLGIMRAMAGDHGFTRLIVPARPSLKSRYPLQSISTYITWKDDRGEPFDPWLRVHVRNGGKIVKVCERAMRVVGSLADWKEWTGLTFCESGDHIVPGALCPIRVDIEADLGEYIEPNVWVLHPLPGSGSAQD